MVEEAEEKKKSMLAGAEDEARANPLLMRHIDMFFDRAVCEKEKNLSKTEKEVDNSHENC